MRKNQKMDIIRENLFLLQDVEYKKFIEKIIPNSDDIIGVRMPILKKMAIELLKSKEAKAYLLAQPKFHEEKILQALITAQLFSSFNQIDLVKNFVPQINNWSVCDTFCTYLKGVRCYPAEVFEFLKPYLQSSKEFEVRFALVLLLFQFMGEEYLSYIFEVLDNFSHTGYYAQMGAAWLLSICYIKFPVQTMGYLKWSKLDTLTYNKGIQKILESKTLDEKLRVQLKSMKK